MEHQPGVYNELKEIAPFLAGLEKANVFYVPDDYFPSLGSAILKTIIPDYILAASEMPFSTPAGYFENFTESILQKIKNLHINLDIDDTGEELKPVSPLLYNLKKENVFNVPAEYFETFSNTILHRVKPQARVVIMKKRSMVWNCAAAAMITAIMAITALWTGNISPQQDTFTADNNVVRLNIKEALTYKNENQVDKEIANLSDADIIKYLESTGSNADDEALASGVQEKELPDEMDYLSNENTLQMFLDKTDSKNNQN